MSKAKSCNIFWFRRDLRLDDNSGLYYALKEKQAVLPIFIFDTNILSRLSNPQDARVSFIYNRLKKLQSQLHKLGSSLRIFYGKPEEAFKELTSSYNIHTVFANHDFEPYANKRDAKIKRLLRAKRIKFKTFKDHVIFEQNEVTKKDGMPYTVFTPYSKAWHRLLATNKEFYLKSYITKKYFNHFFKHAPFQFPTLASMGFEKNDIQTIPSTRVQRSIIKQYAEKRNFPGIQGTSKLGIHFRFGTISIREKARRAVHLSPIYLNELIWRDFYHMILHHFPHVVDGPFRKKYERIEWLNDEADFQSWCKGQTGYPIVDAGMRELNQTGFMHNRVRMIVASFLTKHLLIDWRWGEAYFAEKLLDFDLASNNGGWQWAAGCGTDAAPYFRIFNPDSQQKKFDKDFTYIKKWVPEYETTTYPQPIVEHKFARERCLKVYKSSLNKNIP